MRGRSVIDLSRSTTTTLLLDALKDSANAEAWTAFDQRYRPIVIGLARHLGAGEDDAAEIAQQTLFEFLRDYREGRYDRGKGRLRAWIVGIARHRIIDAQRRRARLQAQRGESVLTQLPDDNEFTALWDAEHRRILLERAWRELRDASNTAENTLRAFELVVLHETPPERVAAECGLEVAEVYRIKHRLTRRLRGVVERLEAEYEDQR